MEWIIGGIIGLLISGIVCWFVQKFQTKNTQQIIESAKTQMGETFRAAAADALRGNTDQFLSLANENFNKAMEFAKRVTHATRLAAAALARSYVACTFSHSFGDVPRT